MAEGDAQAAIDRLHGVPPEDFVAERKRLAGRLRAGGERAAAAEVAKLPKPSAPAWALNHVAREEPEAVEPWLATAAALREASTHVAQVGGDALRGAMAAHRAATSRLTDVVVVRARPGGRPLSEAMLDRVRALLAAATADAGLAERLRDGCLTEQRAERDGAASASLQSPSGHPATTPPARPPGDDGQARAQAQARAERRAELERRIVTSTDEVARLRDEAARRADAAQHADERVEEARSTLSRAEAAAAAAHEAAGDVEQAAAVAEHELRRLGTLLQDAGG